MGSRLAPAILGTMRSKWGSRRSRRSPFREHRIFKGARRNLPQERPERWARAIIDAWKMAKS